MVATARPPGSPGITRRLPSTPLIRPGVSATSRLPNQRLRDVKAPSQLADSDPSTATPHLAGKPLDAATEAAPGRGANATSPGVASVPAVVRRRLPAFHAPRCRRLRGGSGPCGFGCRVGMRRAGPSHRGRGSLAIPAAKALRRRDLRPGLGLDSRRGAGGHPAPGARGDAELRRRPQLPPAIREAGRAHGRPQRVRRSAGRRRAPPPWPWSEGSRTSCP